MSNKAKKKSDGRPAAKAPQEKTRFLPLLAVGTAAFCVVVMFLVNRNGASDVSSAAGREINGANTAVTGETQMESGITDSGMSEAIVISSGESLVIPTADITSDASFFPVEVNGTGMEVIAVRDSDGNIRTAFNTCQICYASGRGYYVQSGNYLVCQNCGNRFSTEQVEIEAGGCNPWPIFAENKTETAEEISISYDFLAEAQGIFANWKGSH